MSRTYRRKKEKTNGSTWCDLEWFTSEYVWLDDEFHFGPFIRIPYPKDSVEYKRGKAKYHSDAATTNFKEPGPSWFRNLFSERPLRQKSRRELQKFMLNEEYEPMIDSKGKLPYWT